MCINIIYCVFFKQESRCSGISLENEITDVLLQCNYMNPGEQSIGHTAAQERLKQICLFSEEIILAQVILLNRGGHVNPPLS